LKKLAASAAALVAGAALVTFAAGGFLSANMPPYRDNAGNGNYTEKITGLYLAEQSAARADNLIIYGSSELRTTEISTHPANFFAGKRNGFQVNLIGRGSCQSLIHAISIAATGDALRGKKVVLITSPQSYVPGGIAPDQFMANFSPQQYLELMRAGDLPAEIKAGISARVLELFDEYEAMPDSARPDAAIRYLAEYGAGSAPGASVRNGFLSPYYAFSRYLYGLRDGVEARRLLLSIDESLPMAKPGEIDWAAEEAAALADAQAMTSNNDYGMLDDYYTTYIGTRLARQQGRDTSLDYSVSEEYGDLRLLFEICRAKGIEPLFVHVPLHGEWSDYTGFTAERRQEYYRNVRDLAGEYGIETLDLTPYEYEDYFLCDVMHLGWKGWLQVDRALIDYYYGR
jgi:D-alanine transfer protein